MLQTTEKSISLRWCSKEQATLAQCGEICLAIQPTEENDEFLSQFNAKGESVGVWYEIPFTETDWEVLQAIGTVIDNQGGNDEDSQE